MPPPQMPPPLKLIKPAVPSFSQLPRCCKPGDGLDVNGNCSPPKYGPSYVPSNSYCGTTSKK
jgi:hypothetical protein